MSEENKKQDMSKRSEVKKAVWELKLPVPDENLKIELAELKDAAEKAFRNQSPNAKQKLVYDLLDAAKNKDQNRFFYLLLKSINKPKEQEFNELWRKLKVCYDILPGEAFINLAYSIIIGIMSTYTDKGQNKEVGVEQNE